MCQRSPVSISLLVERLFLKNHALFSLFFPSFPICHFFLPQGPFGGRWLFVGHEAVRRQAKGGRPLANGRPPPKSIPSMRR